MIAILPFTITTKRSNMKKSTFANRPINPKTGLPYREGTKKFNEWWETLSDTDKNIYADLTAKL